ncbi:PREDICTED: perlucin-like protein [Priapulus caudatus]|uniref:Perlucin-like protein n=1 Tax=Priapulus caudatus TaxID=37621 RepID=A0ABM1F092_PRICU|nr:PREDICTED: perlucin-like protein [Priapulus caudatus]XP_014677864.1 PREDICTED: perlucin-like protein [Priapulus caudatus]XP_014677865.1 PREDICTED: perlucin-like protein [Priapulus caudatus]
MHPPCSLLLLLLLPLPCLLTSSPAARQGSAGGGDDTCVFALTYNPLDARRSVDAIRASLDALTQEVRVLASRLDATVAPRCGGCGDGKDDCSASDGYERVAANYCLRGFTSARNWTEASEICRSIGGQLLSIDSAEKLAAVAHYGRTRLEIDCRHEVPYWISTRRQEARWRDGNTGRQQAFADWDEGEPKNESDEACVELWSESSWKMLAVPCSYNAHFICEKV